MPLHPIGLMMRVYKYVLPEVDVQLKDWLLQAKQIPDVELREQAIASIETKRFHCEGGAVYAAANLSKRHVLIPLIVALQTISDYLDNLCDRSTSLDAQDFRQLHLAMQHAVDPNATLANYYAYRTEHNDGGYLERLVLTCQSCICLLPNYGLVQSHVSRLVGLYSDLQVYKHIHHEERDRSLQQWWSLHQASYPELQWNEFAAATGSTLGVFLLFLTAADDVVNPEQIDTTHNMYFPFVCSLHIMLDYLIDREEDRLGGDLNFCEYYTDEQQTAERIGWIAQQARLKVRQSEHRQFHGMVVEGLLALYLSDPKVNRQPDVMRVTRALMRNSTWMRLFFWLNSIWIRKRQGRNRPMIQNQRDDKSGRV